MPQHPFVDYWLEKWEDTRQRQPVVTVEWFVTEVCLPDCEAIVRDFRRAVRDLDCIDRVIDAMSGDEGPEVTTE